MEILDALSGLLWGPAALAVFVGAGLYMTFCSGAVQLRRPGAWLMGTLRRFARGGSGGGVAPFQALATALGGTVGTGNIAGVTLAIALGGPGVLFWMWVSAAVGMATKYAEVLLAVKFRERGGNGERVGGPMYFIKNGLPRRYLPLAYVFSAAGALSACGMGSAVQSGEICSAARTLMDALGVPVGGGFDPAVGIVTALLACAVLLGGAKRLGNVAALLVPGMSLAYIAACLAVIWVFRGNLPGVLGGILRGAFAPEAGLGACVSWGFRRGIFSNEAGLGSSPIAHAASTERDCVRQGLMGVFEVFADTIVICTLTGLTLLVSGVMGGGEPTTERNAEALASVFGPGGGAAIIAAGIALFSFSSLLSWGMYGGRCCAFLFGERSARAYLALFCLSSLAGSAVGLDALWLASDILNALMAAPNIAALILLGGTVRAETRRCFAKAPARGRDARNTAR